MKTVVLDIETTGLPAKGYVYDKDFMDYPYLVSFSYKIDGQESKYYIINQEGRPIPPEATKIHGITDEMCAASPFKLRDVMTNFLFEGRDNAFAVGHNIYFDTSNIKANILRLIQIEASMPPDPDFQKLADTFYSDVEAMLHKDKRIDTMMRTIKFCGLGGKWPKLSELAGILFPGEVIDFHNAKSDVDITYRCYIKLKELGIL